MNFRQSNLKLMLGYCAILLIMVLTSYSNIKTHTFLHWDDINYILRTEFLRPLSTENLLRMFTEFSTSNWHPITWLSYAVDFSIWGEQAPAFKITNIFIHFLNSLLVFYLGYLILGILKHGKINSLAQALATDNRTETFAAMLSALLFAIHPQHAESVAWISGRKDLLCALFYFSAIIAYLHQHYANNKTLWRNITSLAFVLALMSKPIAITLPVILIFLDIYLLKKYSPSHTLLDRVKQLVYGKLTYFFLAIAVLMISLITQTPNITGVQDYTLVSRITNATTNYFYYITSIIFPALLSPYHPLQSDPTDISLINWISVLLFISAFILCVTAGRKNYHTPMLILGSYMLMLLPAIGLLHLGHAVRADRYAYIPTTGFYIFIGYVITQTNSWLSKRSLRSLPLVFIVVAWAVFLSFNTYQDSKAWMNDKTLWQTVIDQYPHSAATAHVNLGNVLFMEEHYTAAIDSYKNAIKIDPAHIEAMRNLGATYNQINDSKNAEKYYHMMIEAEPDSHYPYIVVGDYYFNNKNIQQAALYYQKALDISPSSETVLYKNGVIDLLNGDLQSAEQKVNYLLTLRPNNIEGLQLSAQIKLAQKDYESAVTIANAIIKINSSDAVAQHVIRQISQAGVR